MKTQDQEREDLRRAIRLLREALEQDESKLARAETALRAIIEDHDRVLAQIQMGDDPRDYVSERLAGYARAYFDPSPRPDWPPRTCPW